MRTWIFCFGIMLLSVCKMQAQNDPVLAGMIYAYTDKAEKELKNQEKVMLMQTTGHIWLKEEWKEPPICNESSTTTWTRSAPSWCMLHRYMASITI